MEQNVKLFPGVYFNCTNIEIEVLRNIGITPDRLTSFLTSCSEYNSEYFEWANYALLDGWNTAEGISACKSDILELLNYNKWPEEQQLDTEYWGYILNCLAREVYFHIISDWRVLVDWLDDGSEGDRFFVIADTDVNYTVDVIEVYSIGDYDYNGNVIETFKGPDADEEAIQFADEYVAGKCIRNPDMDEMYDLADDEVQIEVYDVTHSETKYTAGVIKKAQ